MTTISSGSVRVRVKDRWSGEGKSMASRISAEPFFRSCWRMYLYRFEVCRISASRDIVKRCETNALQVAKTLLEYYKSVRVRRRSEMSESWMPRSRGVEFLNSSLSDPVYSSFQERTANQDRDYKRCCVSGIRIREGQLRPRGINLRHCNGEKLRPQPASL